MEAKLREYRALRRRKELEKEAEIKENSKEESADINNPTHTNSTGKMTFDREDEEALIPVEEQETNTEENIVVLSQTTSIDSLGEEKEESWNYCLKKWAVILTIWLAFYLYFLKLKFGAVYFVVTVLIGICLNTRTRPRMIGEVSAYSVFNENCQSIEGTLDAEQFEREIRYGPGSVR